MWPSICIYIHIYIHQLIDNLKLTICKLFDWFKYNNFKATAFKCHVFLPSYKSTSRNINGSII